MTKIKIKTTSQHTTNIKNAKINPKEIEFKLNYFKSQKNCNQIEIDKKYIYIYMNISNISIGLIILLTMALIEPANYPTSMLYVYFNIQEEN